MRVNYFAFGSTSRRQACRSCQHWDRILSKCCCPREPLWRVCGWKLKYKLWEREKVKSNSPQKHRLDVEKSVRRFKKDIPRLLIKPIRETKVQGDRANCRLAVFELRAWTQNRFRMNVFTASPESFLERVPDVGQSRIVGEPAIKKERKKKNDNENYFFAIVWEKCLGIRVLLSHIKKPVERKTHKVHNVPKGNPTNADSSWNCLPSQEFQSPSSAVCRDFLSACKLPIWVILYFCISANIAWYAWHYQARPNLSKKIQDMRNECERDSRVKSHQFSVS